jgi:hypothetical protein
VIYDLHYNNEDDNEDDEDYSDDDEDVTVNPKKNIYLRSVSWANVWPVTIIRTPIVY